MSKQWALTQDSFERLLAWLDSDRERAGRKYEEIRQSLIKIFTWRGVTEAEDLADETINRVTKKIEELKEIYTGDPALYFYGVAKKILLEYQRQRLQVPLKELELAASLSGEQPDKIEQEYDCLDKCLQELSPNNREIILSYYKGMKQANIDSRKDLAARLGVDANALRVRMHRIRSKLENCVRDCLKTNQK